LYSNASQDRGKKGRGTSRLDRRKTNTVLPHFGHTVGEREKKRGMTQKKRNTVHASLTTLYRGGKRAIFCLPIKNGRQIPKGIPSTQESGSVRPKTQKGEGEGGDALERGESPSKKKEMRNGSPSPSIRRLVGRKGRGKRRSPEKVPLCFPVCRVPELERKERRKPSGGDGRKEKRRKVKGRVQERNLEAPTFARRKDRGGGFARQSEQQLSRPPEGERRGKGETEVKKGKKRRRKSRKKRGRSSLPFLTSNEGKQRGGEKKRKVQNIEFLRGRRKPP